MTYFDAVLCKIFNEHQIPLMHRPRKEVVEEQERSRKSNEKNKHRKHASV